VSSVPPSGSTNVPLAAETPPPESTLDKPVVNTDSGYVIGRKSENTNHFLGIPFAKPPTGSLRWRSPELVERAKAPIDATDFKSPCIHTSMSYDVNERLVESGAEDCLYLNVWQPLQKGPMPVMVFIHGGGFQGGSTSEYNSLMRIYDAHNLANKTGVIVVTIAYRVGVFGFMSHPALDAENPEGISGNYGLLDQIAALKWVQRNIANFRGDPNNVTIFGQSAGAMSVLTLVSSPAGKGLFHRAIAQSGDIRVRTKKDQQKMSDLMIETFGCYQADYQKMMSCMRSKNASFLVKNQGASLLLGRRVDTYFRFTPTIDGFLIPDHPEKIFTEGKHNRVPLILGHTSAEAPAFSYLKFSTNARFNSVIDFYVKDADARLKLKKWYNRDRYGSYRQALAEMRADMSMVCTQRRILRAISSMQAEPVYKYIFDEVPKLLDPVGPMHGADIFYTFQHISWIGGLSNNQKKLERNLAEFWTTFAKDGLPRASDSTLQWRPYRPDQEYFVTLSTTPSSGSKYRQQQCDLIDEAFFDKMPFRSEPIEPTDAFM